MAPSVDGARADLHERLLARRGEIESVLTARVFGISTPAETMDPAYVAGLRAALSVALDYAFFALRVGERRAGPPPTSLTAQARMAARNGVGLDTVLRRYLAGYAIFIDFAIEEAEQGGFVEDASLQRILRGYAAVFDRLIAAVSEEHARESQIGRSTLNERRADRVRRLLDGEPIDHSDFEYDLEAHHLALIASGPGPGAAIRALAATLNARPLLVLPERDVAWAWFACSNGFAADRLEELGASTPPPGTTVSVGEPGQGLEGWRRTHRQARSAHSVADLMSGHVVRYRDVALLPAILRDGLLTHSLRAIYLDPLDRHRDGGDDLEVALSAYFRCGRNVSSAAAALRLNRRTLSRRLQTVERLLGRPLDQVALDLEVVLRLRRLNAV